MDFCQNLFLFDYLTFSSRIDSIESICDFLGLDFNLFYQLPNGLYGYHTRFYYDGITLLADGHSVDMGICVQMSGAGCRYFESSSSLSWSDLLYFLFSNDDYNISRLDVAYDDHTGIFDIDTILNSVDCQFYRSPSRSWTVEYGSEGCCIYIGSKKSDILVRIYDKARERGYDIGVKHWIRLEFQFRDDHARNFVSALFSDSEFHLGLTFLGVCSNYLVFVDPSSDSNKSRWSVSSWWNSFLCDASKIKLFSKVGVEYNESHLFTYLHSQPAGAIKTYVRIYGLEGILDLIDDVSLSPKYLDLLRRKGLLI